MLVEQVQCFYQVLMGQQEDLAAALLALGLAG